MEISPAYKMNLLWQIENELWDRYKSYKKVEQYISFFQDEFHDFNYPDFSIDYTTNNNINLAQTLGNIAKKTPEKLVKIAIDLGIETPDFIPSIPMFRNKLKDDYKNAAISFEKAFQNIEVDPAEAIGNANSVLESIIKEILLDKRFSNINPSRMTMNKLIKEIIKVFELHIENHEVPTELKAIGSALTTVAKSIEDIRSDKTLSHGQASNKYLINKPIYAYFVVNACATVGLFLINFYENKFPKDNFDNFDDLPF
ncbi:abortive infection family protein [Staphylococcus simulans]|uniref:abortive infection family protein n=1 Tax=Staphylococcus simulans TaxID=1286 RepID=UPI001E495DDC|nr:abortive infection family protein [Staphylococcus simulans]MCD8914660.1 abortive infection family protein [Staphylococcus simulans]